MKAIINAKIITNKEILEGYYIIFQQKILGIIKGLPTDKNIEIIDAKGAYLSTGFIDIHIHGSGGFDVMDATYEALNGISKSVIKTGVTSFLATTLTMSEAKIKKTLKTIKKYRNNVDGARILGVHLEGPFINPKKVGGQNPKYIQSPNLKLIKNYMNEIKIITLSPEIEGMKEFIEFLNRNYPNIVLSIGHTNASLEEAKESFDLGISHATHLFNAMNTLHHREVGTVGAILSDDRISCEIIADNIHINPILYNILYKIKRERLILVTDAMRAGGLGEGEYDLGGLRVIVKGNEARLKSGELAGSVLKLNRALKNFYDYAEITLPQLINMVTTTPAKILGLKNIGKLKVGYHADIILFDNSFNILKGFIGGEKIFSTF